MSEKQSAATDSLLRCSQKLAIKCGKGGLTDAGYGESIIKGIKDDEIIIISTKDRIIQSRIIKTDRENKVMFIHLVLTKFSEFIKHEKEDDL